ncbi:molybdopterin synthase sulfur carrier subunit [Narcine bancroftii]|uniref:molybdopterin synthase sulfur carrier subunit n=1 Tax=Narcine bancroftii TaxID=1343680 RepID=UPI0038315C4D
MQGGTGFGRTFGNVPRSRLFEACCSDASRRRGHSATPHSFPGLQMSSQPHYGSFDFHWHNSGPRVEKWQLQTPKVTVLYFAKSAELSGIHSQVLSVPQQLTSLQLWQEIVKRHPRLGTIRDHVILAVRQEYIVLGDQLLFLEPGDEIAVIPPISGG